RLADVDLDQDLDRAAAPEVVTPGVRRRLHDGGDLPLLGGGRDVARVGDRDGEGGHRRRRLRAASGSPAARARWPKLTKKPCKGMESIVGRSAQSSIAGPLNLAQPVGCDRPPRRYSSRRIRRPFWRCQSLAFSA